MIRYRRFLDLGWKATVMFVVTVQFGVAQASGEVLPDTTLAARASSSPSGDEAGEIVVTARGEHRVGHDLSASVGAISGDDIRMRPLLRTSELAEAVPGLIAVQHSGGGKAARYYIRGYNLDHGTDFSISLDGVPMNLPTHAHGQGYLDLNGLIPETIDRIDYRKGPYSPADGDFSFIAAASMRTADRVDRSFVTLEGGSYDFRRIAGVTSVSAGGGDLLLAGDFSASNGPWQLPEELRHYAGFAKYSTDTAWGTLHASLSVYDATWRPTEQIPVRAMGSLGLTATGGDGWEGAVRLRHVGPRPLIEDNSVRRPSTTVVNLRFAKHFARLEIAADLLNLFNTRRADADYFYASRLPGEPLEGVDGVHSRPVESRQLRVSGRIYL
ncbi:MAG: hypothetical protein DI606_09665 [Sphingobium sp.]|uniref:TonB-dependent receptor plug domain-containing protein n=1 Tax=Sphingobium sp. TaxID=1912891 RepID=UPI000DB6FB61|nr:TonB-dependent receptor [Sphingobium sp.]PZU12337.1 MAG: hypothetical protein DI606_09665 [Sphingobium sp.]